MAKKAGYFSPCSVVERSVIMHGKVVHNLLVALTVVALTVVTRVQLGSSGLVETM